MSATLTRYIKQLAGESIIYGVASAVNGVTVLFLTPLYTRCFSQREYGIYSLILVLNTMLSTFATLGMDNAASRWFYDSDDITARKKSISVWFWVQLITGIILTSIIIILRYEISNWLTEDDSKDMSLTITAAVLFIPCSTAGTILFYWFRLQRKALLAITVSLLQTIISISSIFLCLLYFDLGVLGIFVANLFAAVVISLTAFVIMRDWFSPKYFFISYLRPMLHYSLPMIPATLCLWIMINMDRVMLKELSDINEVGVYAVASTFALGIGVITQAFAQAWGPFAFSIMNDQDAPRVYAKVLDIYCIAGCFICCCLALLAPVLIKIFATPEYSSASILIGILGFGTLFNGARYISTLGCNIAKKSIPTAISIAVGALVNLILNFLLIPLWGGFGAAIATVFAWGASVIYLHTASQHYYYIGYRLKSASISLLLSAFLIVSNYFYLQTGGALFNIGRFIALGLFIPLAIYVKVLPLRKSE